MNYTDANRAGTPTRAGNKKCKKKTAMQSDTRKASIRQAEGLFRSALGASAIAFLFEIVYIFN